MINNIKTISLQHHNINDFYSGDIFSLNEKRKIKYPLIFVELNNISSDLNDITNNLRIYYVDRLLNDNSNELNIQIDSGYILSEIIDILKDIYPIQTPFNVELFKQRFNDNCAGGFVNIYIKTKLCI